MATKTYTDDEYAAMEAALAARNAKIAEENARLAAEAKALEDAQLKDLRTWLASDRVKQVSAELAAFVPAMKTMPRVLVYAYDFLGALSNAAGPLPTVADNASASTPEDGTNGE